MKRLLVLAAMIPVAACAQLKTSHVCNVYVDVLLGTVNGAEPDYTPAQVKKVLPCFTSEEAEGTASPCGGIVHYKDNDVYFYTGRDYVEIRENFKGKLSLPIMGAARDALVGSLGYPKIKDANWDAFQTQYGTLIIYFNAAGKVNKIQFSSKSTDTISLCE